MDDRIGHQTKFGKDENEERCKEEIEKESTHDLVLDCADDSGDKRWSDGGDTAAQYIGGVGENSFIQVL